MEALGSIDAIGGICDAALVAALVAALTAVEHPHLKFFLSMSPSPTTRLDGSRDGRRMPLACRSMHLVSDADTGTFIFARNSPAGVRNLSKPDLRSFSRRRPATSMTRRSECGARSSKVVSVWRPSPVHMKDPFCPKLPKELRMRSERAGSVEETRPEPIP